MPLTCCFSYEAEVPPRIGHRGAAEAAPSGPRMMVTSHCFSYPSDVPAPSGPRRMTTTHCLGYPG